MQHPDDKILVNRFLIECRETFRSALEGEIEIAEEDGDYDPDENDYDPDYHPEDCI